MLAIYYSDRLSFRAGYTLWKPLLYTCLRFCPALAVLLRVFCCPQYVCVGTPVTRLCITHDDQFLLAADEAGCVFVFDVRDRQDRGQTSSKLIGGELQHLAASEVRRITCQWGYLYIFL